MSRSHLIAVFTIFLTCFGLLNIFVNEPSLLRLAKSKEGGKEKVAQNQRDLFSNVVTGISITYNRLNSFGNSTQSFLKNEVLRGAPDGNILVNYTVDRPGLFKDKWMVIEGNFTDLIFPERLELLQPAINDIGQLHNTWTTRINFRFNREFSYEKNFLYWLMINIPIGKCREIQVRVNDRVFVIPFTATLGLNSGKERVIKGVYTLSSKADLQAKHRIINCP